MQKDATGHRTPRTLNIASPVTSVPVGRTLTANRGSWTPTPTSYSYRWYRGSTPISGATQRTYRLTSRDVGAKVRVRVTAHRAGSRSGVATSAATRAVTR